MPKRPSANVGQRRQAIVHDAATLCGVRMDVSTREGSCRWPAGDLVSREWWLWSLFRRKRTWEALIAAVRQTPVLKTQSAEGPLRGRAGARLCHRG